MSLRCDHVQTVCQECHIVMGGCRCPVDRIQVRHDLCDSCEKQVDEGYKRPPLGVKPRKFWLEDRANELCQAALRYVEARDYERASELMAELADVFQWHKECER